MPSISLGPFSFDRDLLSLQREGRPVGISRPGAALLAAMLDANGAVVGKNALMEAGWSGTIVEEANLTVQIAALRKALGAGPDGHDWIATVPRVGYRLHRDEPRPPAALPAIAVLPFTNLSSDPEQEFFADGMVEEIITALSRFKTFAVIARNSTFAYRGRPVDVRVVARELGVRYVLEGSVRRAGRRMRVTAQLVDGETGAHLWADRFEGEGTDVFDFQDEITTSVIGFVEPQIRRAEIERGRRKRPERLDAWDLYVQALPIVFSTDVPGLDGAIRLLERAIVLDPNYAPALVLAAWAHERRHIFGRAPPPGVNDIETAFALIDQAMQADPDDPLVLAFAGRMRTCFRGDVSGLGLCDRALALNPNSVLILDIVGIAHQLGGSIESAIACAMRGLQLSPGSPDNYVFLHNVAIGHYVQRNFEEAAAWARRSIEANGNYVFSHLNLARSCAFLGLTEEARREMLATLAIQPGMRVWEVNDMSPASAERDRLCIEGMRKAGFPEG